MRWPVCLLSWLNEIFSDSEVAGYSATGHVTRDRRRKPFQLARGAMYAELRFSGISDSRRSKVAGSDTRSCFEPSTPRGRSRTQKTPTPPLFGLDICS